MMIANIKILLVDDHDVVRKGLKMLLETEKNISIIGEASNGLIAIDKVSTLKPDVVILDLTMPEMGGIEATKIISEKFLDVKILIFSMHNNSDYIVKSVENGAKGYLLKDSTKEEILKAINTVAMGKKYFPPDISEMIIDELLSKTKAGQNTHKKADLSRFYSLITSKEKEILDYIIEGKISREIAEKLNISIRTVDNHRANMMKKTNAKNTADLVKLAIGS
jgi:DNA-binding NarL/FixJ family response regulator